MKTTIINKQHNWFNPYFLNGKQIDSIIIFNSSGKIGSFKWFGSNNKYPEILIPCEVKNKRKIDFNQKGAFLTKGLMYGERVNLLYININNFTHTEVKQIENKSRDSVSYYASFHIDFMAKEQTYVFNESKDIHEKVEDTEFKQFTEEVKTFLRSEKSLHKLAIERFIDKNNLGAENSEAVYNTLRVVGMLTELDKV